MELTLEIFEALTDNELKKFVEQRHDGYQKAAARAQIGLDLYEAEQETLVTNTYLPQGTAENDEDFAKRLLLTQATPVTPRIVNQVAGQVFEPDPVYKTPDNLADYMSNADQRGRPHVQIMTDVFCRMLAAGAMWVHVDSNLTAELRAVEGITTVADEKAKGIRPLLTCYDPRSVLNWAYDYAGLAWIHLLDTETKQESWNEEKNTETLHLIVTRSFLFKIKEVEEDGKTKYIKAGAVAHQMRECPVYSLIPVHDMKYGPGIGSSYIRTSTRADISALRCQSYVAMNLHIHGTPHLWRRFSDDEWELVKNAYAIEMTQRGKASDTLSYTWIGEKIMLGTTSYHILMGAGSDIGYATVDIGPTELLQAAEDRYRDTAIDQAGFEVGDIIRGAKQFSAESGIAKAFSYSVREGGQLELLSMVMEQFDTKILQVAAEKAGGAPQDDQVRASYPQPRIIAPFEKIVEEIESFIDLNYPPAFIAKLKTLLVGRARIVDGLKPGEIDALVSMVENAQVENSLADKLYNEQGKGSRESAPART